MSSAPPGTAPAPTTPPAPPTSAPPLAPSASPRPPAAVPPTSTPPPPATPGAPAPSPPAPVTPAVPSASPPPPSSAPPPSTPGGTPPSTPSPPPSTSPSPPSPPSSTTPPSTPSVPSTPSPPGSSRSSPPPARRSPPSPSSQVPAPSSSGSGISTGVVVGIAIGGVALLVVFSLLFICCKKKKRRRDDGMEYYGPPPPLRGPKDGPYGVQPQQWQPPPPPEHVVSMLPKPTPPPSVASRPPPQSSSNEYSTPRPPPPPPFMNSSGGSGSNFSGPDNPLTPPSPGLALGFSKSTFTYEELAMATDGFSDANLLGQGGFGYVHRGMLPNGKEIAVKQLKIGSGQGEREFQAEVEIISRVHHKHLVSLVGYCIAGTRRMLVYEFVPNNTMEFHLHGKGRPTMDWATRMRIALGSAKGLAYLHEDCNPKIIHRDIKAANILLDLKFEAKVADFGLAKFSSETNTHVSTRVMGTFGYLAPEYAASGKLTEKSDVFSFGVMLLEMITGRRPVDSTNTYMDDSLVDWARPLLNRALEDGNYDSLVDARLQRDYSYNEMACMVSCAAACVRHSARRRPRMSQVVRALEGDASISDLHEGLRPGQSNVYSSYGSSDYDNNQYNEDMKKFRKMALASQEYGSSEYSAPTSEYGLQPSASSSEGHHSTGEMEMGKTTRREPRGFS
ncbi:hypothetical protein Scep_007572 [Stephania cephalantha]|uniref:non-specific serine/threonine protein kinase n=1 Tax=Stephania cephalantha TaxID=152367 RepID=A0AAP0KCS7_9MAGN